MNKIHIEKQNLSLSHFQVNRRLRKLLFTPNSEAKKLNT